MFAIAAAVIFAIDLLLDFLNVHRSDPFTWQTLVAAGLLCLALHLAGFATDYRRSYRRRR